MKKLYLTRTIKFLSLLIPVVLCTLAVQSVFFCNPDKNSQRCKGFYKEENNSLDVVLMGSSEVFADFYPGVAYRDYGITSYDWAIDSASITLWKTKLDELKKYQSPQLLVVDVSGAFYEDDYDIYKDMGIRYYIENMPLSFDKAAAIASLPLEDEQISYYLPIIKYHSYALDINLIKDSVSFFKYNLGSCQKLRGIFTDTLIDDVYEFVDIPDDRQTVPINKTAEGYLRDFLAYCKDNAPCKVVFTAFPHRHSEDLAATFLYKANRVEEIVEEYGFDFINFDRDQEQLGFDYEKDFYNCFHLSFYGAEKVTKAYCDLFTEKYGVKPSEHSDATDRNWAECVEYTDKFIAYADECVRDGRQEWLYENPRFMATLDNYNNNSVEKTE